MIPTVAGDHLVQSLAAHDDALAVRTLHEGRTPPRPRPPRRSAPLELLVARFLTLGLLRVITAWTPATTSPAP